MRAGVDDESSCTSMRALDGIRRARLQPRARRTVLHDAARRPGRAGDQDRSAGPRRRHAGVGPAVRRGREHVFHEHQPQQGIDRGRLSSTRSRVRSSSGCSRWPTSWSRTSGRARWRGSDTATTRSPATHPRLVYCSISGFGQTGPRGATRPATTPCMQAEGGLMSITGDADGPPFRLGVAIADIATGLFAAQGILAALLARERTGRGQLVDVAMLDSVAALLTYQAGIVIRDRHDAGRGWATGIPRLRHTIRSPPRTATSCLPSATTSSSAAWPRHRPGGAHRGSALHGEPRARRSTTPSFASLTGHVSTWRRDAIVARSRPPACRAVRSAP